MPVTLRDVLGGLAQAGGRYFGGRLAGETAVDQRRRQMAQEALDAERIRQAMQLASAADTRAGEQHTALLPGWQAQSGILQEDFLHPGERDVRAALPMEAHLRELAKKSVGQANLLELMQGPDLAMAMGAGTWQRPVRPEAPFPGEVPPLALPQAWQAPQVSVTPEQAPYMPPWGEVAPLALKQPMPQEVMGPVPVSTAAQETVEPWVRQPGVYDRDATVAALQGLSPEQLVDPVALMQLTRYAGGAMAPGPGDFPQLTVPTEAERAAAAAAEAQGLMDMREQLATIGNIEAQAGQRAAQGELYGEQAAGQYLDNVITAAKAADAPAMQALALQIEQAKANIETIKAQVAAKTQNAEVAQAFADLILTRYEAQIKQYIAETGSYPTSRSISQSTSFSQSQSFMDPAWLQLQAQKFQADLQQYGPDYALRAMALGIDQYDAETRRMYPGGRDPSGSTGQGVPPFPKADNLEGGQEVP
jgi:hypothetical protein